MAGMLVAINDKPLDAQQHQAEVDHLAWLMGGPERLKRNTRARRRCKRTLRIVEAMPDAFRYQLRRRRGGKRRAGKSGAELSRLKFTPNPEYSPPSRVEQVLQGMEGYLLIDRSARREVADRRHSVPGGHIRMGDYCHLDKGGHFRVQQADGRGWIVEHHSDEPEDDREDPSIQKPQHDFGRDIQPVPQGSRGSAVGKGVELLKAEQKKSRSLGSIQSAAISKESQ